MKKLIHLFAFYCLGPGLIFGSARAQEAFASPATVQLTLSKAEELALAGNPHIRAAEARERASSKQASRDLAPADPVFSIDRTFPGTENWYLDESLGMPGKSFAKADLDGAETKRLGALAEDVRRSILLQARQAFWDFYSRQKAYDLQQEAQKQWKDFSRALESKELTGQWISLKAVRMQMETAKAANGLITSAKSLRVSQFNLNHLFDQPHGTSYELSGEILLPPFEGKEEDYVQKTLNGNPAVAAFRGAVESREASKNLAALDHLPDLSLRLSGTRDPNGKGFSDYGFMVGVSLPLFFPFKQTQALDQAGEELSAARSDLRGAQNEAVHMTEEAYVEAESDWRILRLYEEGGLLKQTQRAWAAAKTAYRNEQMPLSELLESFSIYLETVQNYHQSQADYGKALARLRYESGETIGPGGQK